MLSVALYHTDPEAGGGGASLLSPQLRDELRSTTFNNQGCLERRRKNFHQAEKHLLQAIAICPPQSAVAVVVPMVNLSALLTQIGRTKESASMARKALAKLFAQQNDDAAAASEQSPSSSTQPGLLAVAFHALAVALETMDPKASLDNYDNAHAAAVRELSETSHTAGVITENRRRYLAYLHKGRHITSTHEPSLQPMVPSAPPHGATALAGGRKSISVRMPLVSHGGTVVGIPPTAVPVERFTTPQVPPAVVAEVKRGGVASVVIAPTPDGDEEQGVAALVLDTDTVIQRHDDKLSPPAPPTEITVAAPTSGSAGFLGDPSASPAPRRKGSNIPVTPQVRSLAAGGGGAGGPGSVHSASLVPKPPPPIDGLIDETKRKDDIINFMVTRLGLLLKVEDNYLIRYKAAHKIQCAVRPFLARLKVARVRHERELQILAKLRHQQKAVRCIQRFFKLVLRKKQDKQRAREMVVMLQNKRKSAAVTLQKYVRRWIAVHYVIRLRKYRASDNESRRACMRWVGAVLTRIHARKLRTMRLQAGIELMKLESRCRSATKIQASYRMHRQRIAYLCTLGQHERALRLDWQKYRARCATRIQALARRYVVRFRLGPQLRVRFMRRHNKNFAALSQAAALKIQRVYRGYVVRHRYSRALRKAHEAAKRRIVAVAEETKERQLVRLQAWGRMIAQRQRYRTLLKNKREQCARKRAVVYQLVQLE